MITFMQNSRKVNYDENRNKIAFVSRVGEEVNLGSDKGEASRVMFYILIALQMAQLQTFSVCNRTPNVCTSHGI